MKYITRIKKTYIDYDVDRVDENCPKTLSRIVSTRRGKPTQAELAQGELFVWRDDFAGYKGYECKACNEFYDITIPLQKDTNGRYK